MAGEERSASELPTRWQGLIFGLKASVFRMRRSMIEWGNRPPYHIKGGLLWDGKVLGEARTSLWLQVTPAEFPLTAGKAENLRISAKALHGVEVAGGEVFSFWRQLGRTTQTKGYTKGRELREGCLVPNVGGGLCQITGLLYQAALKAGLTVVERHAHSRLIPGSMGEQDLDATVFWNYVDLRFKADFSWRVEVELDATDLWVRIKGDNGKATVTAAVPQPASVSREAPTGDCLTCHQTACFRHPSATAGHAPAMGHSSFLLDACWPEFDHWCAGHSREGDYWFTPLDGGRWKKPNYAWSPPEGSKVRHATMSILWRSFRQRGLPAQGPVRQAALLEGDAHLAKHYASRLSPECRHLVVAQNLLPHLWKLGVLGGRTFDVLMQRWPLGQLLKILDEAAEQHPESVTLGDFRPDPDFIRAEREALALAGKVITPHRAIAAGFGERAWLLDWIFPKVGKRDGPGLRGRYFLPCSPLGRKGVFELKEAFEGGGFELLVLGRAREDSLPDFFQQGSLEDLESAEALVLPAWVEHQPRLALRALAMNIPVFATKSCGLPGHPLLTVLSNPTDLDGVLRNRAVVSIPCSMSEPSDKEITLEAGTYWMCKCGKSANYPFCDGAHKGSGMGPEKLVLEEATVVPVQRPPAGE